ncbi:MAG TPA: hypothetical protein VLY03_00425 [Bacteroidota bacterium]|nr:hypothetical protein [Bacteroidota bacterium]
MKRISFSRLFPAFTVALCLGLAGCATVKDTLYLQDVSVSGPVQQVPIHINDESKPGTFHISPYFAHSNQQTLEGSAGVSAYSYEPNNLHWSVAGEVIGADFDVMASRSVAFTFGIGNASGDGNSYASGNIGLGLLFYGDAVSGRFDGGLRIHSMNYDASTVVVRETTSWFTSETNTTTMFFHDNANGTVWDYYLSLMLNSKSNTSPVNVFIQLAFSREALTDFNPSREVVNGIFYEYIKVDTRASSTASILMFTPGVYVNVGQSVRLLGGVRIAKELNLMDANSDPIFMPVFQLDLAI